MAQKTNINLNNLCVNNKYKRRYFKIYSIYLLTSLFLKRQ